METGWRPIRVGVSSVDEKGQSVLVDGKLAALLVNLASPFNNPELQRSWTSMLDPSLMEHKVEPERVLS